MRGPNSHWQPYVHAGYFYQGDKFLLQGVEPSGDFQRLFYLASRILHPSFTSILITFKFKLLQTYLQQRRCTHSYLPNKNND